MDKKLKSLTPMILGMLLLAVTYFFCNFDIHKAMMPEDILGVPLTEKVTGVKEAEIISNLHMSDITADDSIILYYRSEKQKATIYVSFFQEIYEAKKYIHVMREKIIMGSPGFSQFNQFKSRELDIFTVIGFGQVHYFFAHYNHIFWLAIDYSIARQGVAQILEVDESEIPEL